ncbi:MAG: winged helix-turn-helix domain-containing protein [Acidobacteriota bacterium]
MIDSPFSFDGWRVWPDRLRVEAPDGRSCSLQPQVMRLLVELAGSTGRTLTRDELLTSVWDGRAVTDDALTVAVYSLRKVLGDRADRARYLETIKGRGYRWCVEVAPLGDDAADAANEPLRRGMLARRPNRDSWPRLRTWCAFLALLIALAAGWGVQAMRSSSRVPSLPVVELDVVSAFPEAAADRALVATLEASVAAEMQEAIVLRRSRDAAPAGRVASHRLEVRVLRRLDLVQTTVTLIDVETGIRPFTDRWTSSIPAIEGVATQIAETVDACLSVPEAECSASSGSADARPLDRAWVPPPAEDAWIRGEMALKEGTADGIDRALTLFDQSLEQAPGFVPALTARAVAQMAKARRLPVAERPERVELARRDLENALAIDPSFGPGWAARGVLRFFVDWQVSAAEADLQRAFQLSKKSVAPHAAAWRVLSAQGRHEAAVSHAQMAARWDAFNSFRQFHVASALTLGGRFEEALEVLDGLDPPRSHDAELLRVGVLDWLGRPEESFTGLRAWLVRSGRGPTSPALDEAFARGGLRSVYGLWLDVEPKLEGLLGAAIAARADRPDEAMRRLESLFHRRDPSLLTLAFEPAFTALSSDPRFIALLDDIAHVSHNARGRAEVGAATR